MKWVYAVGFLVWSLATAAVGLVNGLFTIIGCAPAAGDGRKRGVPGIVQRLSSATFPKNGEGWRMRWWMPEQNSVPDLSTLLGGLTVDAFGWRAMFLFVGLASLLWLAPWLLIAKPDAPVAKRFLKRLAPAGARCCDVHRFGEHRSECFLSAMFFTSCFPGSPVTWSPSAASR